jgi:type I restriction enzyme S subunit
MHISLGARHDFLRRFGVADGWTAQTLGDLARVVGGGTPSRDESRFWIGGTIPWATPTDLTANRTKLISNTAECITEAGLASSATSLLPAGSILYTSRATIGAKAIAAVPITTNQGFASFLPDTVDGDYLYYLLDLLTPVIRRLGAGTTFDEVSKRDMRTVWCAVPSDPDEQAAIARILDAVDTALECTRAAVERARELERSALEDAFANLEAPHRRLREFTTDIRYGTSKASSDRGWGNPVLRIPNVVGDRLSLADLASVELPPAEVDRLRLHDGDLLLVRTNGNPSYVGRSVVFRLQDERAWVYASYLIRVRLRDGLLPDFVNVFLGTERGRRELLRRVTTSAGNHNINSNSIRLLSLPAPDSTAAQERIVQLAGACRSHVDALQREFHALANLKRALTNDLLTGRVRVRNELKAVAP